MHRYVKRSMGSSVRRPAIGMASFGSGRSDHGIQCISNS